MHPYRTHNCGELRTGHVGTTVRLSGWVHSKRDHGGLLFLDLRDHYGLTQIVVAADAPFFGTVETVRIESVVTVTGPVVARSADTVNPALATGNVEVRIDTFDVESPAATLPLQVAGEQEAGEAVRLSYRFLDLRREKMQRNLRLRADVIVMIRRRMTAQGFLEIQTPILTASSPEGARDFLVPSRLHPGRFYALPQAPQQFKAVADDLRCRPVFPRSHRAFATRMPGADRSPGEFYQLDVELAFATQDDVFAAVEPLLRDVFAEFGSRPVAGGPFPRIAWREAMLRYGTDKPDLRNPLEIADVTAAFRARGRHVSRVPEPDREGRSRPGHSRAKRGRPSPELFRQPQSLGPRRGSGPGSAT